MRKSTFMLTVGCAFAAVIIAGNAFGNHLAKRERPILESTALYPDLTMQELTDKAHSILYARVENVGDTYMYGAAVSLTEDFEEAADTVSYPVTPITLVTIHVLKGEPEEGYFTYFEMGGITSDYIRRPDGYAMEEGMEVILFLNEEGFGWGAQSIFPVVDGQVILTDRAVKDFSAKLVSDLETESINAGIRSQLHSKSVKVMGLENFNKLVEDMLKEE